MIFESTSIATRPARRELERGRLEELGGVLDGPCEDVRRCPVVQVCIYALDLLRGPRIKNGFLNVPSSAAGGAMVVVVCMQ